MPAKIGLLLPRSTEFPSMSFDLLDGFRLHAKTIGLDFQVFTENTGFGEDPEQTHARAEKLVIQDDVDFIISYSTSLNAEALYSFAETTNKPFLFVDPGMEIFEAPPHRLCRHLTLQGLTACRLIAEQAMQKSKNVIAASSFLDGGYRSSWVFHETVQRYGGEIKSHFVSHYKDAEFTVAPLVEMIRNSGAELILASFSSYLDGLLMKGLREAGEEALRLPFYCAPFMADEQILPAIPFPGGEFHTVVPWSLTLPNEANRLFTKTVKQEKNKNANLFHLLGWEAAAAAQRIIENGISGLDDWSFNGPRGEVHFDKETHSAFAPLYSGHIGKGSQGECSLVIEQQENVSAELHRAVHFARPEGQYSRWKNNFLCI